LAFTILEVVEFAGFAACLVFFVLFCIQLTKRRKTLFGLSKRMYAVGAALVFVAACMMFYALFVEPSEIEVRQLVVEAGVQARFVFISDAHVPSFNPAVFDKIREQEPDAILFGGDVRGMLMFSDTPESAAENSEFFSNLSSIAPVYAVSGNHDWGLPQMDATFLINEKAVVNGVTVCGVDDRRPAEVTGCDIALVHSLENLRFSGNSSVTFLGHTHGGGINLPVITENVLNVLVCSGCGTYRYGEHIVDGKRIYVTSGIVNHVRFMAMPEIVVVDAVK